MRSEAFSFVGYEGAAIYYERTARDPVAAHRVLGEAIGRMRHLEGMDTRSKRLERRKASLLKRFGPSIRAGRELRPGSHSGSPGTRVNSSTMKSFSDPYSNP